MNSVLIEGYSILIYPGMCYPGMCICYLIVSLVDELMHVLVITCMSLRSDFPIYLIYNLWYDELQYKVQCIFHPLVIRFCSVQRRKMLSVMRISFWGSATSPRLPSLAGSQWMDGLLWQQVVWWEAHLHMYWILIKCENEI